MSFWPYLLPFVSANPAALPPRPPPAPIVERASSPSKITDLFADNVIHHDANAQAGISLVRKGSKPGRQTFSLFAAVSADTTGVISAPTLDPKKQVPAGVEMAVVAASTGATWRWTPQSDKPGYVETTASAFIQGSGASVDTLIPTTKGGWRPPEPQRGVAGATTLGVGAQIQVQTPSSNRPIGLGASLRMDQQGERFVGNSSPNFPVGTTRWREPGLSFSFQGQPNGAVSEIANTSYNNETGRFRCVGALVGRYSAGVFVESGRYTPDGKSKESRKIFHTRITVNWRALKEAADGARSGGLALGISGRVVLKRSKASARERNRALV